MTQNEKQQIENRANAWHEKLVSGCGQAETVGGEVIRAAVRLLYRYHNDGDTTHEGYGIETCWCSWAYLVDNAPTSAIHTEAEALEFLSAGMYGDDDEYDNTLYRLLDAVCNYLDNGIGDDGTPYTKPNETNSRDYAMDDRPVEYDEDNWDE